MMRAIVATIAVLVSFIGMNDNTWTYSVLSPTQPSISHVTFRFPCDIEVLAVSEPGTEPDNFPAIVNELKFDRPYDDNEQREIWYKTGDGYFVGEVEVVVKRGQVVETELIQGPVCTPTSLNIFNFAANRDSHNLDLVNVTWEVGDVELFILFKGDFGDDHDPVFYGSEMGQYLYQDNDPRPASYWMIAAGQGMVNWHGPVTVDGVRRIWLPYMTRTRSRK